MVSEREQAEVLARIAALEQKRTELVAARDALNQEIHLREQLRIFEQSGPPKPKKGGALGLWVAALVMVLATWSCLHDAPGTNRRAEEAASQL